MNIPFVDRSVLAILLVFVLIAQANAWLLGHAVFGLSADRFANLTWLLVVLAAFYARFRYTNK